MTPALNRLEGRLDLRKFLRLLAAIGGGACVAALVAAPAFAGNIDAPTGNPFAWPGDASGDPLYHDVTVSGFQPGQNIYLEVCDGSDPATTPGWDPVEHCDSASSPSPLLMNASGGGTFEATDFNHKFRPFKGESPQGLFICKAAGDPDPPNPGALPIFTNCRLRASSNNGAATADQTFLKFSLPDSETPPPDVPEVPLAVALPLGAAVVGGAFLIIRKRRAAHAVG